MNHMEPKITPVKEPIRAPIPRAEIQRQLENSDQLLVQQVRQGDNEVVTLLNSALTPDIDILLVGDAEKPRDTSEICGMYDKKVHKFRFVTDRLTSVIAGISDAERYSGTAQSEDIYAAIRGYANEAVEKKGYQAYENGMSEYYAKLRQTVQANLPLMVEYAGMLSARGEKDAALDVQDLGMDMLLIWRDWIYEAHENGYEKLEKAYAAEFDQAIQNAVPTRRPLTLGSEKAGKILKSLAIHAEEMLISNEDYFTVWSCCRAAQPIQIEYPDQRNVFQGGFTPDRSERFTKFGSRDCEHLAESEMFGQKVLVFNQPVPHTAVPQDWHSYHLTGRNLCHATKVWKSVPSTRYLATVLSPNELIRAGCQSRRIPSGQIAAWFGLHEPHTRLAEFCEKQGIPQPDMSGVFPERQVQTAEQALAESAKPQMEGVTL